jgi:hypothetical protein
VKSGVRELLQGCYWMESTGRMGGKIDMMALELEVLEVTV